MEERPPPAPAPALAGSTGPPSSSPAPRVLVSAPVKTYSRIPLVARWQRAKEDRERQRRRAQEGRPYHDLNHRRVDARAVLLPSTSVRFLPSACRPLTPCAVARAHSGDADVWRREAIAMHQTVGMFALVAQRLLAVQAPLDAVSEALECAQEAARVAHVCASMAAGAEPSMSCAGLVDISVEALVRDLIPCLCMPLTTRALEASARSAQWCCVALALAGLANCGWRVAAWLGVGADAATRIASAAALAGPPCCHRVLERLMAGFTGTH